MLENDMAPAGCHIVLKHLHSCCVLLRSGFYLMPIDDVRHLHLCRAWHPLFPNERFRHFVRHIIMMLDRRSPAQA